jgi:hypothetical protein
MADKKAEKHVKFCDQIQLRLESGRLYVMHSCNGRDNDEFPVRCTGETANFYRIEELRTTKAVYTQRDNFGMKWTTLVVKPFEKIAALRVSKKSHAVCGRWHHWVDQTPIDDCYVFKSSAGGD